jgi:hypothetical protein
VRDEGLYRFGPLGSVIPYSCTWNYACAVTRDRELLEKPNRASPRVQATKSHPLLGEQRPPFIVQGNITCTASIRLIIPRGGPFSSGSAPAHALDRKHCGCLLRGGSQSHLLTDTGDIPCHSLINALKTSAGSCFQERTGLAC